MNQKTLNLKGATLSITLIFLILSIMPVFSSLKTANASLAERQNTLEALANIEVRVYVGNDGTIGMEYSAHPSIHYRLNDAKINNDNSLTGSTNELLTELSILETFMDSLSAEDNDFELIEDESYQATGFTFSERIEILNEKMREIEALIPESGINNLKRQQIARNRCADIIENLEEINTVFAVVFPDPNLEAAIRAEIDKPTGNIYPNDLSQINSLSAANRGIADLTGIEHCVNLVALGLAVNEISDVNPLAGLTKLTTLDLRFNSIEDITPLLMTFDPPRNAYVNLWSNPLDSVTAPGVIAELQLRGVNVNY